MLFSICSQTGIVQDPRVSLVGLWDQVMSPRGQILVSRTDDFYCEPLSGQVRTLRA